MIVFLLSFIHLFGPDLLASFHSFLYCCCTTQHNSFRGLCCKYISSMLAGWLTAQVQRLLCFESHNVFVFFFPLLTSDLLFALYSFVLCCSPMLACLNVIAIGHWYKIDYRHPFRVEGIVDRYQSLIHSPTHSHTHPHTYSTRGQRRIPGSGEYST